jgi:hypothetical protein
MTASDSCTYGSIPQPSQAGALNTSSSSSHRRAQWLRAGGIIGLACCAASAVGIAMSRYNSSRVELLANANLDARVEAAFASALRVRRTTATRSRQQKLAMISEGTPAVVGGIPGYFSVPGYFTPAQTVGVIIHHHMSFYSFFVVFSCMICSMA